MQAEQTLKQEPDMPATDENAEAGIAGGRLVLVKRLAPVAVIASTWPASISSIAS